MSDILPFPPQGIKCATCPQIIVLRDGETLDPSGQCFCCRHQIPLALHTWDGDDKEGA